MPQRRYNISAPLCHEQYRKAILFVKAALSRTS
jgi:hypothetical protein